MADEKIQWHPGFLGGIELALRKYKSDLSFDSEHPLSKKPLQMDVLIIKKNIDTFIDTSIGRIFSTHNVIEYKSPDDGLTVDDYFKVMSYACLYKSLSSHVNEIRGNELSISLFRDVRPVKLFKDLKDLGAKIEEKYNGVYYVTGVIMIPTQIVVTSELDDPDSLSLKVLSKKPKEEDVVDFAEWAKLLSEKDDRENADAVLQVSVTANDLYDDLKRRYPGMCDALMTLMKPEIDDKVQEGKREGKQEGKQEGVLETLASLVKDGILTLADAARRANLTPAEFQKKTASML